VYNFGRYSEGYRLNVDPREIVFEAGGPPGFFYAVQTLLQLLPAEIFSETAVPGIRWAVPAVRIADAPRYPWNSR